VKSQCYFFTRAANFVPLTLLGSIILVACGQRNENSTGSPALTSPLSALPASTASTLTLDPAFATATGLPGQPLTPYPGKPGETTFPTPFPAQPQLTITALPRGADTFDRLPTPSYIEPPTPLPSAPYHMTSEALLVPGTTQDDTAYAEVIATGNVLQVGTARWTTVDGKRPANPHADNNREYIFTPVVLQVNAALKGAPGTSELALLVPGGVVGQDSVDLGSDHDAIFQVGERVMVFLNRATSVDRVQLLNKQPLWRVNVRYTLTASGTATNRFRSLPLSQLVGEINRAQGR